MTLAESITNYAGSARQEAPALDQAAFQLIYEATARPLWAYLLRVSGRRDVADDLLQETYCRFLGSKAGELAMSEAETRSYLFRVATNLLRDRWRRGESALNGDGDSDKELAVEDDPAAKLDVRRMMRALKPRARQLLWLAYVEGMSHAEIAEATGLSVLSIRLLLFRARRHAAELLRPDLMKAR
jgi:RNA polymerase sigma-70 factor, ECF subfamily